MTEQEASCIRVVKFRDQQIIDLISEYKNTWRPGSAAVHIAEFLQTKIRGLGIPTPPSEREASS